MTKPFICPKCNGEKVIFDNSSTTAKIKERKCPTCQGDGIVWHPPEYTPKDLKKSPQNKMVSFSQETK